MLTTADLDALERLNAAASPGPWFLRHMDDEMCCSATAVATLPNTSDDNDDLTDSTFHGIVAVTHLQHRSYVEPADRKGIENAQLIAAMRSALPELLRLARLGSMQEGSSDR